MLLFLFLTAMTGSVALIETRKLGLSRRMLATAGILPPLGVLAAYAVVLLALAAWRLRHVLAAGA